MQYTNDERIKIFQSLYKIFRTNNLVNVDLPEDFVDGLAYAREKKLMIVEPISSSDYVMPFWVKRKNNILLSFPTPPYDKKVTPEIDKKIEDFINDTRDRIKEISKIRPKPKKLILDLRSNVGGFIHAFYNALYPLLPVHNGQILSGVDLLGNELMTLSEKDCELSLIIQDPINGQLKMVNKIMDCNKTKLPKVEVWVNSRSASSSEMIMIMFAQAGHKVVGQPTMGLTSGMLTQLHTDYAVNIPYYWFKDKNGKIYNATTRPKPSIENSHTNGFNSMLLEGNVVAKIPQDVLKALKTNTPSSVINHIHCKYLETNAHFGIVYSCENPTPNIQVSPDRLYIHLPEGCNSTLGTILDSHRNDVLMDKPIIIDLRNSRLKGLDSVKMFESLFKPYTLKVVDGQDYYVSAAYPFVSPKKQMVIGKYANANVKIWVNKNSIHGDLHSLVLLKYLLWAFGVVDGSELPNLFDHSLVKYTKRPYTIEVYSCKYDV